MVIVVMGVAGSGKTTIGKALAARLRWQFADADDFHSSASIDKMARGIPLDESDREPWLDRLRREIQSWTTAQADAVLACSALKASYRQRLTVDSSVRFVYLKGDSRLFAERLRGRPDHYMKESMLASQFAALEEPHNALTVDSGSGAAEIVEEIVAGLGLAR